LLTRYTEGKDLNGSEHFGKEMLFKLNIHHGNPEAIAELIKENRQPKPRPRKRAGSRKPEFGGKKNPIAFKRLCAHDPHSKTCTLGKIHNGEEPALEGASYWGGKSKPLQCPKKLRATRLRVARNFFIFYGAERGT
jgi:hypothetical protein